MISMFKVKKENRKSGFTLVELMVVAIIVAVLAAVAIPLMTANVNRAIATEADSGLGTVRANLRAMYAETKSYAEQPDGTAIVIGDPVVGTIPGFGDDDLDGRYFSDESYTVTGVSATGYEITAAGASSTAPKASKVATISVTIDEDGEIVRTGL